MHLNIVVLIKSLSLYDYRILDGKYTNLNFNYILLNGFSFLTSESAQLKK